MFAAFIELFPAEWRAGVTLLTAPLRWVPDWQASVVSSILSAPTAAGAAIAAIALLAPALLLIAGVWCTMASLYTLPFRAGRRVFLTAFLMTWWDAGRAVWLYWMGLSRVIVGVGGWVVAALRFIALLLRELLLGVLRAPLRALDWVSRRWFPAGVPWAAFVVLLAWSAIEATTFAWVLHPVIDEVLTGLTGRIANPRVLAPLLTIFLFLIVAGSFACMQAMREAIQSRRVLAIASMLVLTGAVMFFEVIFLYRELVDAMTPWVAHKTGGAVRLGLGATLGLAALAWSGIRATAWFLFAWAATPALLAMLSRRADSALVPVVADPAGLNPWRAPVLALQAETGWFHDEGRRVFELLSLPVLQLLAVALNFAVVTVQSRPVFVLPFRTMDDMVAAMPGKQARDARTESRWNPGVRTPRDPMTAIAS